jgi:hypothetical protein
VEQNSQNCLYGYFVLLEGGLIFCYTDFAFKFEKFMLLEHAMDRWWGNDRKNTSADSGQPRQRKGAKAAPLCKQIITPVIQSVSRDFKVLLFVFLCEC